MVSIFPKNHPQRNWKGCEFEFYPGEFLQSPNKEIHFHVINEKGSMKIRLNPVERDTSQGTNIPPSSQKEIIKFVKNHLTFIRQRIKEELIKRNIKTDQEF